MFDALLSEPALLFSLSLTAKTCLVTLGLFSIAGPLLGTISLDIRGGCLGLLVF